MRGSVTLGVTLAGQPVVTIAGSRPLCGSRVEGYRHAEVDKPQFASTSSRCAAPNRIFAWITAGNDIDTIVSDTHYLIMVSEAYHHPIGINADDIDHMGHVNNSVYLKWVQEAVVEFWEKVAPPEAVAKHLWIALSHEIKYRRPTFLDDLVVADVIAEKVDGARAFFTTVIKRGNEVLAEVKSSWCCLDAASRRPVRLAREIAQRFLAD